MRKIIQAVASVAILAASMVHAAPAFAVMSPPDMDNPCMQYGCTIPPLETVYDPHQTQTEVERDDLLVSSSAGSVGGCAK